MSSHEIFMKVYANDRNSARLREAQAHRQSQTSRQPIEMAAAWRNAGHFFYRLVEEIWATRKSEASYHVG
jgi:hypothetical protein